MQDQRQGPLVGLRVIEMAGLGPCPLAGQLLADLGAEVTVIDRASGPLDKTDINNRGKRSVALNIKADAGRKILLQLIAKSDVLIEGFRPGVMERLGLGPDGCHSLNPRLIYGRMTGWGQTGPMAQQAGHDINYLGLTGILNAIGPGDQPVPPLNIAADYGGGTMFLLLGVLSALYERQHSGQGQVIDAAMVDGASALMGLIHQMIAQGRWSETRQDNWLDGGAPFYRTYECADGKYIAVGALEPQFFAELVAKAGLPEADVSRQNDSTDWPQRHDDYAAVFRRRTRAEWTAIFDGSDACVTPVLSWSEAPDHPHIKSRGSLIAPDGITQSAPAPRFDRTPAGAPNLPMAPGAATDDVLTDLGLSPAEIASLRADQIIG